MNTSNNTSATARKKITKRYKNLDFCMRWTLVATIVLLLENKPYITPVKSEIDMFAKVVSVPTNYSGKSICLRHRFHGPSVRRAKVDTWSIFFNIFCISSIVSYVIFMINISSSLWLYFMYLQYHLSMEFLIMGLHAILNSSDET